MATTAWFLPPAWVLVDAEGALTALELASQQAVRLEGALRAAALAGEAAPLAALAGLDRRLEPLAASLAAGPAAPWTRASLLRGAGFGQLFLELTARCNERCVHCYAESHPERDEALELPVIQAVLDDARALGFRTAQLTGGDPLVSPHAVAAARHAVGLGFPTVEVYTNGLLLHGRTFAELAELGVAFAFSVYSHDAQLHDAITRRPGSHALTLAAVQRAAQAGLRVRVGVIAIGDPRGLATSGPAGPGGAPAPSAEDVARTVALVEAQGVARDDIRVDAQRGVGRGDMGASLRPDVLRRAVDPVPGAPGDGAGGALAGPRDAGHRAPDDRAFSGRIAVGPDGRVMPCIFDRGVSLGNVHEARLRTLLTAELPLPVPAFPADALSALGRELACWDCRVRHLALGAELPRRLPLAPSPVGPDPERPAA